MNQDGKVKATFTIAVSPKDTFKHKDPILKWKEVIDTAGKIGDLNVKKESTKLREEIPCKVYKNVSPLGLPIKD